MGTTTMAYSTTDSTIGANLNVTNTAQQFPLGTRVTGTNGTVWIYGKANMVIKQYDFVTIDASYNINSLMAANVLLGQQIGVAAAVAFASADYGWIAICGENLLGNVMASVQINVPVIPGTTTGTIATTSGVAAGVTTILGVGILATGGLTATAVNLNLTSPVLKL
jgi:hypothetical protein